MPAAKLPTFYEVMELIPDEKGAIKHFENLRWPNGVQCIACKSDDVFRGKVGKDRKQKVHLPRWECRECHRQFTVICGTVMENTKIPLRKWLMAFHEIGSAKHGISSRELARKLGITLRSAWHLSHRIRATMADNTQQFKGIVETDETYIGGKRRHHGRGYRGNKVAVQTIVSRTGDAGVGQAQTMALGPNDHVDGRTVGAKLRRHTEPKKTVLMTDDSQIYDRVGKNFAEHHTVNHSKEEYVRQDVDGYLVSTNTAEGLFANLKRQIIGTHHSTSKKHLPRYLEEYDYKYNTRDVSDTERTATAMMQMEGKRVRLFKSPTGDGDALFDRKADEPSTSGTRRGEPAQRKAGIPVIERGRRRRRKHV